MAENEIGVTVNSQTTSLTRNSQITSLLGNSSEESPTLCPQLALTGHSIVVASLLTMFISLAAFGNALVILSVLWNRQLQTATNLFICNLAVADLLISVCVLPFSATLEVLGCWPFGRVFCDTWAAVDVLCCTASILSLCAIAVDRYIGVRHSLHYRFLVTRRRAGVVLACVWTVCGALSAPPLLGWKEARSPDINICTVTQEPGYALFSSLLSFYLPLGVVLAVYTQVYVVARRTTLCLERGMKRERHPPGGAAEVVLRIHRRGAVLGEDISGGARRMHSRVLQRFAREKKAAKTLAMVVGVFVFCWLPFFIVLPLGAMFPMLKPTETVFKVVFWLGYFNSCINPFIYPCSNREFRQAFMKLLRVPTISWSSNGPLGGSVGNNQKVINTNPTQIPPLRNSVSQQITCFHLNIRWWSLFRRGSLWLQELMDSQTSKVRQGSHQQSTHNSTGNLNSVSMEISSMSTN